MSVKKNNTKPKRAAALALLCLILFSLTGCAANSSDGYINCLDEKCTVTPVYAETVSRMLPSHTVVVNSNRVYYSLEKGAAAAEAYDVQAKPALEHEIAGYWYPQYLATVVIAVDRDSTGAVIDGWGDLAAAGEAVGISGSFSHEMIFSAIAYGLEGDRYTINSAAELLAGLRSKNRLAEHIYETPVVICYDFQAAAMIKSGRNIEIIIPREGTLAFERGLLSREPLSFSADKAGLDDMLISAGFRLPDGRCDGSLYPGAESYESAAGATDYRHFTVVCNDSGIVFRRTVLRTRLFSSANTYEHQLFVLVFIIIAAVWIASIFQRAMQKSVRRSALFAGIILFGWVTARLIKFLIVGENTLLRYLWYSYYLFQLSLPMVALWLASAVDKQENGDRIPKWLRLLAMINGALIILVFTNDIHNLVFRLDLNTPGWSVNYGYGFGFWLVQAACWAPIGAAVIILIVKSVRNPRKKQLIFPVAFIAVLILYSFAYVMRIPIAWDSDITLVIGLFTILFYEAAVRTGMIPVNTKYTALFTHSTLDMAIMGGDGKTTMYSASAIESGGETPAGAAGSVLQPARQDENTLFFTAGITGGSVTWQEDVTVLNRLHAEVGESVRRLNAANNALAAEAIVKRSAAEESERTRLITRLEAEIAGHTAKLSDMAEKLENAPNRRKETIRFTLYLCYVKRLCNLFYRQQETQHIPTSELTVYLDELAEIASHSGVKTIVTSDDKPLLSVRQAALFFNLFHSVMDWAAEQGCEHMLSHLASENGNIVMRMLSSENITAFDPGTEFLANVTETGGVFAVKDLDAAVGISLSFPEGGDGVG